MACGAYFENPLVLLVSSYTFFGWWNGTIELNHNKYRDKRDKRAAFERRSLNLSLVHYDTQSIGGLFEAERTRLINIYLHQQRPMKVKNWKC